MAKVVNLMYVDGTTANSNKFYNMLENGDGTFTAEYGRVGSTKATKNYPMSKWSSVHRSKVRKGYKDITDMMQKVDIVHKDSGNAIFESFFSHFSKYTRDSTRSSYLVDSCSAEQIKVAQAILDSIPQFKTKADINQQLEELFKVIPRRMGNVSDYLVQDLGEHVGVVIKREQDALDSMDSSNIIHEEDVYDSLGITFEETTKEEHEKLVRLITPSNTGWNKARIHKTFRVTNKATQKKFDDWIDTQSNKNCELLFHGTRNPNIFSIMKSGLLVRPSNAVSFAGSAYGDGVYHSAHTAKSLGYTGGQSDKIFFIQNVHMGNAYTYEGYYRNGKDISRNQMNYKDLNKLGYDSLYVKAGDGLMNSEYIVYKSEQTTTNYLVWFQ